MNELRATNKKKRSTFASFILINKERYYENISMDCEIKFAKAFVNEFNENVW